MSDNQEPRPAGDEPPSPSPITEPAREAPPTPSPWGLWATLGWTVLMFAAYIAASIIAVVAFAALQGHTTHAAIKEVVEQAGSNGELLWLNEVLAVVLVVPVLLLATATRRGYPVSSYMALKKVKARAWIYWMPLLIALIIGADLALYLTGIDPVAPWMLDIYYSARCRPCMFAAIIVLAPLLEETVFRGFIFTGVEARLGPGWAVVVSVVPWALLHWQYQWYYLVVTLLLGLVFALARLKTGSILVPLAMHALTNLVSSIETMLAA